MNVDELVAAILTEEAPEWGLFAELLPQLSHFVDDGQYLPVGQYGVQCQKDGTSTTYTIRRAPESIGNPLTTPIWVGYQIEVGEDKVRVYDAKEFFPMNTVVFSRPFVGKELVFDEKRVA